MQYGQYQSPSGGAKRGGSRHFRWYTKLHPSHMSSSPPNPHSWHKLLCLSLSSIIVSLQRRKLHESFLCRCSELFNVNVLPRTHENAPLFPFALGGSRECETAFVLMAGLLLFFPSSTQAGHAQSPGGSSEASNTGGARQLGCHTRLQKSHMNSSPPNPHFWHKELWACANAASSLRSTTLFSTLFSILLPSKLAFFSRIAPPFFLFFFERRLAQETMARGRVSMDTPVVHSDTSANLNINVCRNTFSSVYLLNKNGIDEMAASIPTC